MFRKYPKVFASSVDPRKLSLTIKGLIKNVAAVALVLAPLTNVSTAEVQNVFDSLDSFLAAIDTLVVSGLLVYGTAETVVGAVRKVLVSLGWIKGAK